MKHVLEQTYYSNTIGSWLIALLIIGAGVIVGKIIYWVIGRFLKSAAKKTKTKLDDILIDMFEEPIIFSVFIFSFWYGIGKLTFPKDTGIFIEHVIFTLIVFDVAWLLVRMFDALVEEYLVPIVSNSESNLDDQLLPIIRKTITVTIWTIALVVGLNNAGYDVGAVIAGLGIGGLALAMAAKDWMANLFGGLTVFLDKPFQVKDRIVIDGFDGVVEEIGIRSTRLRTLAGRRVTIPNQFFTSMSIENISLEPSRKTTLDLGLTYETAHDKLEKAIELVNLVIDKHTNELEEKRSVGFTNFAAYSLTLSIIYYIKPCVDYIAVSSIVNLDILKVFSENDLHFAYPTQTIITKN